MDAWELMMLNSTAPDGSDAWAHLNNQETGGTGEAVTIIGELSSSVSTTLTSDVSTELSSSVSVPNLTSNINTGL